MEFWLPKSSPSLKNVEWATVMPSSAGIMTQQEIISLENSVKRSLQMIRNAAGPTPLGVSEADGRWPRSLQSRGRDEYSSRESLDDDDDEQTPNDGLDDETSDLNGSFPADGEEEVSWDMDQDRIEDDTPAEYGHDEEEDIEEMERDFEEDEAGMPQNSSWWLSRNE